MTSNSGTARAAVVLGALAVLVVPTAIFGERLVHGATLLHALYVAAPVSWLLGLLAVLLARRARLAATRSVHPAAARRVRLARFFAWLGLYVGSTTALARAVYGVLRWAQ